MATISANGGAAQFWRHTGGNRTLAALALAAVLALATVQPSTAYARGYHSGGFHHSSHSHSHSHSHRW